MKTTTEKWKIINIDTFTDGRGCLSVFQSNDEFSINRIYYLHRCSDLHDRGMHAHKELRQVIIAVAGSCLVSLDDGYNRSEYILNDPTKGLLLSNMVWREISKISTNCVIMVIASHKYNENDYIRNYNEFIDLARKLK